RPTQPASASRLRQHGHSLSPPRRIAENALGCGNAMIARNASGARRDLGFGEGPSGSKNPSSQPNGEEANDLHLVSAVAWIRENRVVDLQRGHRTACGSTPGDRAALGYPVSARKKCEYLASSLDPVKLAPRTRRVR